MLAWVAALYACVSVGTNAFKSAVCRSVEVPSIFNTVLSNRSHMPFPMGWDGVVLLFLIPAILHNFLMTLDPDHYGFWPEIDNEQRSPQTKPVL